MKKASLFQKALWIWNSQDHGNDEYTEFLDSFEYSGGHIECLISCHDDYALFINGRFVSSNQYSDFDHYKAYDRIDVTPYLSNGKNVFALTVWYCGGRNMRFSPSVPGVVFEVCDESGTPILYSSSRTPSRKSLAYASGVCKYITSQLGPSFLYDSTKEDGWKTGANNEFSSSFETSLDRFTFFERPIKRALLLEPVSSEIIEKSEDGRHYTIDLGAEVVGLFTVKLYSDAAQTITVTYGEDLQNGHVRRVIGSRDFSFKYVASAGKNEYTNYFLRLGCRYIEISSEQSIELEYASVIPQVIPTSVRECDIIGEDEKNIYEISLNTLRLCMMEHYVDCPWREQGLYAFDSKNQMLFGYYAFKDGNFEYARANLLLIANDRRDDGLLSICSPCSNTLAIPSFSLHYFSAIEEYIRYSGDVSLAGEVYDKLISIMNVFLGNMKDGLVYTFVSDLHWNFYDWAHGLDGNSKAQKTESVPDCVLNCLCVRALDAFEAVCKKAALPFPYPEKAELIRQSIRKHFFRPDKKMFSMYATSDTFNVLSNILAILSETTKGEEALEICENALNSDITDCTLSLKTLKYEAMLKASVEKYRDVVLNEIKKDYLPMLKAGATSVWETTDGASAFNNAGSLCHGWSASPIYFYHILGIAKPRVPHFPERILSINEDTGTAVLLGYRLKLSPCEFKILSLLYKSDRDSFIDASTIKSAALSSVGAAPSSIPVLVSKINKKAKLISGRPLILCKRNSGYKLNPFL